MARKRHVYPTSDIARLWFDPELSDGETYRNPQFNFYFKGEVIYSYRNSYPIGKKYHNERGERAVLVQEDRYGATTGGHINDVRYTATRRGFITFTVPVVVGAELAHEKNVEWYRGEIEKASSRAIRARDNFSWKFERLEELVREANGYLEFFNLGGGFSIYQFVSEEKFSERRQYLEQVYPVYKALTEK